MRLVERLLQFGIRLDSYAPGDRKITCPQCSASRRNKTDPCLSVTVDDDGEHAVWNCHNCGWKGTTHELERQPRQRVRKPVKRPTRTPGRLTPAALRWFANRGISEATVRRNRIGCARHWIPALNAEVDCLTFPSFRKGELINIKYRALSQKAFAQEKDAEKIFYGLDDIADADEAIIVEGECDKLALEEAGFRNGLSVPDGAPSRLKDAPSDDDAKFEYLGNCEAELARFNRIVLGVDADRAGAVLEEELARRLGNDGITPCKDANETLLMHGPEALRKAIEEAVPYPIRGLHRMADYVDEILDLYDSLGEKGAQRGLSTEWASVDKLMTIRPGELSIVTGYTHSGKSEFLDALMINLARLHGWRFAVCSFENSPTQHIPKLLEKHLGAPFPDGPTRRMTRSEVLGAMTGWLEEHFVLIRAGDETPTMDWILEKLRVAVLRHGVRGAVIDPYNEIEHKRLPGMTETEYVSQILGKVKRFAENHGVHIWIVAHPAKPVREGGKLPVPTLYDISGSANWANKADIGLVVHRDLDNGNIVELYVRKVRFKEVGQVGVVELQWDRVTGRYSEIEQREYSSRYGD